MLPVVLAQGASLSPSVTQKTKFKLAANSLLRFSYSWGHFLKSKDCALLGGNGNTLKIKTTAKLSSKQTSIATVRDLY
jgi:hypothetical protein